MQNFGETSLHADADTVARKLRDLHRLSDEDIDCVIKIGKKIGPRLPDAVGKFYGWLEGREEYGDYFSDLTLLERVADQQSAYWVEFFTQPVDGAYVESRKTVGETHFRIGLPLGTYLSSVAFFDEIFKDLIADFDVEDAERGEIGRAITRRLTLDMGIVVEAYADFIGETLSAQSRSLMEMSTPVTQIWTGLLLLPLVGIIDSKRAQDIMNATLEKISSTQARFFILDISGVAVVDTAVANHMIKITRATKLMGCESIISGVSPAIAQTIVELGIDVGTVRTTANMMDALSRAFHRLGLSITDAEAAV